MLSERQSASEPLLASEEHYARSRTRMIAWMTRAREAVEQARKDGTLKETVTADGTRFLSLTMPTERR